MNPAMPTLILVHRDERGHTVAMPFCRADGSLTGLCSEIADYLAGMDLTDAFWGNLAADRLRVILEQRETVRDLNAIVVRQQAIIAQFKSAMPEVFA